MQFAMWLKDQEFTNIYNVVNGIDGYSRVDESVPRY